MRTIEWFGFVLGALSATGKVIIRKPGERAEFSCEKSSPSSLVWKHGNDMMITTGKSGMPRYGPGYIKERTRLIGSKLIVSSMREEDSGRYTCEADGRSEEHALLVVSVSASPSGDLPVGSAALLQCQVAGLNPGSTVQWTRPNGGPHSDSTVQLKSVASSDAGTWHCKFSHNGETHSVSLEITVKENAPPTPAPLPSQNSKDDREPTHPDSTSGVTKPPPYAILLLGLSWWVWVAVGVGCLVVILLMVLVCVLCKRIKRRKRKMQKMKQLKPRHYCQCNRPTAAARPQQGRRREKPPGLALQPLLKE